MAEFQVPERHLKEFLANYWLQLGDTTKIKTTNIFPDHELFEENPALTLVDIMRRPENFAFTCQFLLNIRLLPFQVIILKEMWTHAFPMLVMSRGGSKSYLLAIYSILLCLFKPGSKVVITGSSFRQSKIIFSYIEMIWKNAPMFRDILAYDAKNNRPIHDTDMYSFRIFDSEIKAIPLGDGSRVRGLRASCLISDEFNSIDINIFEEVLRGFTSVALNPVDNVMEYAKLEALKSLGKISQEQFEVEQAKVSHNQIILSGTCGFTFENLYKYWKRYREIILTKGDPKKLEQLFNGQTQIGFNYKDYTIIRLAYNLLPKRFMDDKAIGQAQATSTTGIFISEYGSCALPFTKIITDKGVKNIIDVEIGDRVLTHLGNFKKVLRTNSRYYSGNIVEYKTKGYYDDVCFTTEHPFWKGNNDWEKIEDINNYTYFAKLKNLSGFTELDLTTIVPNYMELDDKIVARPGTCTLNNKQMLEIINSPQSIMFLSKKFNVSYHLIWNMKRRRKQRKGTISKKILLDYYFGLILGYYAAEGSVGANGRAIGFALDGHKEFKLQSYIQELTDAIARVFGIKPKIYYKEKNLVNVTINNRLIVDLLQYICPGIANNKILQHDILFSNRELLRGFIIGYWNGDGHLTRERQFASATSVSESLITQVKLALSYFDIATCLYVRKADKAIFRGKSYNCKTAYELKIFGQSARNFKKLFYNMDCEDLSFVNNFKLIVKENEILYPIKKKKIFHYDGLVYNLEVVDDNSYSTHNSTVHNCFLSDTDGFFKRSLIEHCVCRNTEPPISKPSCGIVQFNTTLRGNRKMKYVIACDPAAAQDNLAIVVLEIHPDHRRIVYSWTINEKKHKQKLKYGLTKEHDYYRYCARKIRDLRLVFSCDHVVLDAQGGGQAIKEVLGDPAYLSAGEHPLYPIIEDDVDKDTDSLPGEHILYMIQFSNAEWVYNANHDLKKDMETCEIIFPLKDSLAYGLAREDDKLNNRSILSEEELEKEGLADTLEDCLLEIEELKNELTIIEHSKTPSGRDKWDTPQIKAVGMKKGRLRKDRYTALLMANAVGRSFIPRLVKEDYPEYGNTAAALAKAKQERHEGREYGIAVRRGQQRFI